MLDDPEGEFIVDHSKYDEAFGSSMTPHLEGIPPDPEVYRRRDTNAVYEVPRWLRCRDGVAAYLRASGHHELC